MRLDEEGDWASGRPRRGRPRLSLNVQTGEEGEEGTTRPPLNRHKEMFWSFKRLPLEVPDAQRKDKE